MKCLTKTNNGKDQWLVTVTTLVGNKVNSVYYQDSNPKVAVMSALQKAEKENFDGIDLGMEWAYTHPWL